MVSGPRTTDPVLKNRARCSATTVGGVRDNEKDHKDCQANSPPP